MNKKRICLVIPSLTTGGMERVMLEIANYLLNDAALEVHLIIFGRHDNSFILPDRLLIHEPVRKSSGFGRALMQLDLLLFLRNTLKTIKPYSLLSFGSMYNSFVMLAAFGLDIKTFISDRSNPYRNSYLRLKKNDIERQDGIFHYLLRKVLYKRATGVVVQTGLAEKIAKETLLNKNIIRLPNPVRQIEGSALPKGKFILNVGRFVNLKQQSLLVKIFAEIEQDEWKLLLAGDGPDLCSVKDLTNKLRLSGKVIFLGNVKNIDDYYAQSEIFAFTSKSEGFPNALAEALRVPLAAISFDCVAGPSDMIIDGYNGFLVPLDDTAQYKDKLSQLIFDEELRSRYKRNSVIKMKEFEYSLILSQFHRILTQ